jgi:hypothetical protein
MKVRKVLFDWDDEKESVMSESENFTLLMRALVWDDPCRTKQEHFILGESYE